MQDGGGGAGRGEVLDGGGGEVLGGVKCWRGEVLGERKVLDGRRGRCWMGRGRRC